MGKVEEIVNNKGRGEKGHWTRCFMSCFSPSLTLWLDVFVLVFPLIIRKSSLLDEMIGLIDWFQLETTAYMVREEKHIYLRNGKGERERGYDEWMGRGEGMKTEKPRGESRAGMQGIKKCHQQIPYRLMATLLVILSARLTLLIDQFTDESTFGNDKTFR